MVVALNIMILVLPFLWWAIVFFGLRAYIRARLVGVLLVVIGSFFLGTIGILNAFLGFSATFDHAGNVVSETPAFLPF